MLLVVWLLANLTLEREQVSSDISFLRCWFYHLYLACGTKTNNHSELQLCVAQWLQSNFAQNRDLQVEFDHLKIRQVKLEPNFLPFYRPFSSNRFSTEKNFIHRSPKSLKKKSRNFFATISDFELESILAQVRWSCCQSALQSQSLIFLHLTSNTCLMKNVDQ